jgi:hypothetical protein
MQNFYHDIDTMITFNQLEDDGCEIECTVHSKRGHLFYDAVRQLEDRGGGGCRLCTGKLPTA